MSDTPTDEPTHEQGEDRVVLLNALAEQTQRIAWERAQKDMVLDSLARLRAEHQRLQDRCGELERRLAEGPPPPPFQ